jgi:hypothetical protein
VVGHGGEALAGEVARAEGDGPAGRHEGVVEGRARRLTTYALTI